MSGLPVVVSFWHGRLGWLERLSIASFLAHGHRFVLYSYEDFGDLPEGCERADAESIVPRREMFFYKGNRTPAVFADLFRLRLMAAEKGLWVDCDMLCVRPFAGLGDYVFGIEKHAPTGGQVNNAVFRCPPDSALLQALLSVFEPGAIPPGLPLLRRFEVAARRRLGQPLPVADMQFGATGPWPLNFHVRRLGLAGKASAKPVFYPLDYGRARTLLERGSSLDGALRAETLGVHMWHSALTRRGSGRLRDPEPGSFFAREIARLGVRAAA